MLPLDSEVMVPVSVRTSSGIRPGPAHVLIVNPSSEVVVLPSFSCVGYLIPVSAVSVACAESVSPGEEGGALPDHLQDIITGSYPSLGEAGRLSFRGILHRYVHVFPAPREAVMLQHEILTLDARLVRCRPRRLALAGLRTEQTCIKEMLLGGGGGGGGGVAD